MKVKLTRCFICHEWYSPLRSHCPQCGAAPIHVGPRTVMYVDAGNFSRPGIEIVRGLPVYNFKAHALQIAQELI